MRPGIAIAMLSLAACDNLFSLGPVGGTGDGGGASDGDATGVSAGLIAHYTMDSLTAGSIPESVAGRDGKCSNCPSLSAGRVAGGLTFNGTSDVVSVAPTAAFDTTSGVTVAMWFRLETSPTQSLCTVSKRFGAASLNTWQICADPGPVLRTYWYEGVELNVEVGPIVEDKWHHVAMRWDGAMLSMILDGKTTMAAAAHLAFDGGPLVIGGDIDVVATVYLWDGTLDDLRIYDRELSMAEVQALAGVSAMVRVEAAAEPVAPAK